MEQASRILLEDHLEIRRNSEWLGTMGIEDVLRLTARTTVARMLERDDFSRRYRDGVAISVMEFLYPLLQGWDSVMVEADVELGGTDQLFNNLMGRTLQEQEGQEGQCVLTTPLLEGLDGVNKMSKSLGNFVGIAEPRGGAVRQAPLLPDDLMPRYFTLTTGWHPDRIEEVTGALADGSLAPVDAKRLLARTVIDLYHGDGAGAAAEAGFDRVFRDHRCPTRCPRSSSPPRRRAPRRPDPPGRAAGAGVPRRGAVEQGGPPQDRAGRRPARRRGRDRSRPPGDARRGRRGHPPDGEAELGPTPGLAAGRSMAVAGELVVLGWDDRVAARMAEIDGEGLEPARIVRVERGGGLAETAVGTVPVRSQAPLAVGDWAALGRRDGRDPRSSGSQSAGRELHASRSRWDRPRSSRRTSISSSSRRPPTG